MMCFRHRTRAPALVVLLALAAPTTGADQLPERFGLASAGSARGFNLLLVTLDTVRADRLGCYGYAAAATPQIDRLAARGLRFEYAMTVAPLTLPAHATLLTGDEPPRHGVRVNTEDRLADDRTTLAETLAAAGYDTGAFVSSFVLERRFGLGQGFAEYDDRVGDAHPGAFSAGANERRADATVDAAIGWLGQWRVQPFFAWVHLYDAHEDYRPPEPFASRFAEDPYDGEIAFMDRELGRLFGFLSVHEMTSRTLVVIVGDHGEGLGEHGEASHGIFLYDGALRVPLIVANPAVVRASRRVDEAVVSLADLAPTLLDLLGIEDPAERDGKSWLRGALDPERAVYSESLSPYLDYGWAPLYALRTLTRKLILAPREELYDLVADPGEHQDLLANGAAQEDQAGQRLSSELRQRVARQPLLAQAERATFPAGSNSSPETRRRLAALGYLKGAGPAGDMALADPKDRIAIPGALIEANALLHAGRADRSLEVLRPIIERAPHDRSLLQALANVYVRLGEFGEAESALRELHSIRPKTDTSLLLAQILILGGHLDQAAEVLEEAERLEPSHGGVAMARGDLLLRRGRPHEARRAYLRARAIDPQRAAGVTARLAALDGYGASN